MHSSLKLSYNWKLWDSEFIFVLQECVGTVFALVDAQHREHLGMMWAIALNQLKTYKIVKISYNLTMIIIIIIRARHFTCYYICTVWITVCQMQILCLLEVSSVHAILEKMGIHSHDAKFLGSLYKIRQAFNCEFWRLLKDIYTISITYHFQECNPIFAYHGTFSFLWLLFEITLEVLMNKTSLIGSKPDFVLSHV